MSGLQRIGMLVAVALLALTASRGEAQPPAKNKPVPAAKKQKKKYKPRKKQPKKPPAPKPEPAPEIEMDPEPARPPPDPTPVDVAPVAPVTPVATVTAKSAGPAKTKAKKLYLRAGVIHVATLEQSREAELADVDGPASLAVGNGPIEGSGSAVSSATIPGLIIGYRIRPRWAVETVLGVPFTVKFKATGTLRDMSLAPTALGIPTGVPAIGEELGEAKAAPPTVTAIYDLLPDGKIRPYAGAGLSILLAYGGKLTNPVLTEVSRPDLKISPAPGLVLQGGFEAKLHGRIYARADVKFIALMLARARVEHIEVRSPELPLFDTVEVGTAKMSVWVNPLIVQLGIGTDF